jgi:hypothetical protein
VSNQGLFNYRTSRVRLDALAVEFGLDPRMYSYKVDLYHALEARLTPAQGVFGCMNPLIDASSERLEWRLSTADGKSLLTLHYHNVWNWRGLVKQNTGPDLLAALEACIMVRGYPNDEETARIMQRFPGVRSKTRYVVDLRNTQWEPGAAEDDEDVEEDVSEEDEPVASTAPSPPRKLSLDRKITL